MYYIIFLTLILAATNVSAKPCDLQNLHFGITQEQIKEKFRFDALAVADAGEAIIPVGAHEICEDLPVQAVVEFLLFNNALIQMRIINEINQSDKDTILDFASHTFGQRDNRRKNVEEIKTSIKPKLGLWHKENAYSIVYTLYTAGTHEMEKLVITSDNHNRAFAELNKLKIQEVE